MTEKKAAEKAEKAADRYEYTGGTTGHIVLGGQHVADVKPGDVIEARDAKHAALIEKSGHFKLTSRRATAAPGPEPLPRVEDAQPTAEAPADAAPTQESA